MTFIDVKNVFVAKIIIVQKFWTSPWRSQAWRLCF